MTSGSPLDRLCVVLVAPRNPLNIGAAARAMANFGFNRLRIVNPHQLAFHEARSAVGASSILARTEEFPTVAAAIADCHLIVGTASLSRREAPLPVKRLANAAELIRKRLSSSNRVALLFGSEKRGLSNEDLSYCHWLLHIPALDKQPSMNLGQAVALCLYEIVRSARASSAPAKSALATAANLERLTQLFLEALFSSGYLKPIASARSKRPASPSDEKIRRLILRLQLSGADTELLLGIFRQILWKIRVNDSQR